MSYGSTLGENQDVKAHAEKEKAGSNIPRLIFERPMRTGMEIRNYLEQLDLSIIREVVEFGKVKETPKASVVVVTFNPDEREFLDCLESLKKQTCDDFELLLIDNSDKGNVKHLLGGYGLKYIGLTRNYGLTIAKNVGIRFSRGELVIFLDDDATVAGNWIEEHLQGHNEHDIIGLRGRCFPKNPGFFNDLATHYDMGEQATPWHIDLEGNSSFKRTALLEIGGFSPDFQKSGGGDGLDISYRIVTRLGDRNSLIYYPGPVIYHDSVQGYFEFMRKRSRHKNHGRMMMERFPEIFRFVQSYGPAKARNTSLGFRVRLKLLRKSYWIYDMMERIGRALMPKRSKESPLSKGGKNPCQD